MHRSGRVGTEDASLDIDTFDVVVVLRLMDGVDNLV
jgi:hypothetical protein